MEQKEHDTLDHFYVAVVMRVLNLPRDPKMSSLHKFSILSKVSGYAFYSRLAYLLSALFYCGTPRAFHIIILCANETVCPCRCVGLCMSVLNERSPKGGGGSNNTL